MEEKQIVMIFANPIKCEQPIDQARLVRRIIKFTSMEYWEFEYLNEEGKLYKAFIRIIK
jgi:hypothetical protein